MRVTTQSPAAKAVVELLKSEPGLCRTELALKLQVSPSLISQTVRVLISQGTIYEQAAEESSGGRPRKHLHLTAELMPFWVADLNPKNAQIAVASHNRKLLAKKIIPLPQIASPEEVIAEIIAKLQTLSIETTGKATTQGIGFSLPGPVDCDNHRVIGAARLREWNNRNLQKLVEKQISTPVCFENDARAGAIGEISVRGDKAPQAAIYIKAGMGIGGAAIINGQVYRGGVGLAGDLTHNQVSGVQPIPCSCGRESCLETVASGAGILRQLKEQNIQISEISELISLANQADNRITPLVRSAGQYVGEVLAPLVTFLNPETVIIGGSLSDCDAFNAGIRSILYANCLPMITAEIEITSSEAREDAALYGMLEICKQKSTLFSSS